MKNSLYLQAVLSILFVALAVVFLNPFHLWMTSMTYMTLLGVVIVAFGAFTILVVHEQAGDERELVHRMTAGRAAFFAGSALLLLGTAWQAYYGHVDPWLLLTLCGMVAAKVIARIYCDRVQ